MDLGERLHEIDRLPLSPEGRALARLLCLLNEAGVTADRAETERIGMALAVACHRARVPTVRVRRLIDPASASFARRAWEFMRPGD